MAAHFCLCFGDNRTVGWLQCYTAKFRDAFPRTGCSTKTTALAFPAKVGKVKCLVFSQYNAESLVWTNFFANAAGLAILLDNGGNPVGCVFAGILGG